MENMVSVERIFFTNGKESAYVLQLTAEYFNIKSLMYTWEAEIRRITVQGQPGPIVCETPPSPK
jgi:hypothetical protein